MIIQTYNNTLSNLFFKIFKNRLLINYIFYIIKDISTKNFFSRSSFSVSYRYHSFIQRYDEIKDVEWMCRNSYFYLLLDKVKRGEKLVWSKLSLELLFERLLDFDLFKSIFNQLVNVSYNNQHQPLYDHILRYCQSTSAIIDHTVSVCKGGSLEIFKYLESKRLVDISIKAITSAIKRGNIDIIKYLYINNNQVLQHEQLQKHVVQQKQEKSIYLFLNNINSINYLYLSVSSRNINMIIYINDLLNHYNINNNNKNNTLNTITIYRLLKFIDNIEIIKLLFNHNKIKFNEHDFYKYLNHSLPPNNITYNNIKIIKYLIKFYLNKSVESIKLINSRIKSLSTIQSIINQLILFEIYLNTDIYKSISIKYKIKQLIATRSLDILIYVLDRINSFSIRSSIDIHLLLEYCIEVGSVEQLRYLILNYGFQNDYDRHSLDLVDSYEKLVILHGLGVNRCTHLAIDNAADRGDLESVKFLLEVYRAPFRSALYTAASNRHLKVFEYLLNYISLQQQNSSNSSTTSFYFHYNNCKSVEFISLHFERLSKIYRFSTEIIQTHILDIACYYGYRKVVELIIDCYSLPTNTTKYIEYSIMGGQVEILELIMYKTRDTPIHSQHWQYTLTIAPGEIDFHHRVLRYLEKHFGIIDLNHMFSSILSRGDLSLLKYLHQQLNLDLPLDITLAILHDHLDIIEYYLNNNILNQFQLNQQYEQILSTNSTLINKSNSILMSNRLLNKIY